MQKISSQLLYKNIKTLITQARQDVVSLVNAKMVETYFLIGKYVVEFEQSGKSRAVYASKTLGSLSIKLTKEFGKGFSVDNLENMRKFYIAYQNSETLFRNFKASKIKEQKSETASRKSPFKLSWSHYNILTRIENKAERQFYEVEAANENWNVRELKRQYDSALYERLVASRNKKKVKELSRKGHIIESATDAIKDPYILEFLTLKEEAFYSEADLETALINKLEEFLKELGKGFLFVSRQYRITLDATHYHIDLVFYNRILRCFILIDLKIGELEHKDIGQMQMYVNYFDDNIKDKNENKTLGIILCKNKKESVVRYTLPKNNSQIFASKYKMYLPKKDDLLLLMEPGAPYGLNNSNESTD
jgi:predicted nuclease of restriction endonuclease-like (RecB) superfamily